MKGAQKPQRRTVRLRCGPETAKALISPLTTASRESLVAGHGENTLTIQYRFPDWDFSMIWPKLIASGAMDEMGIIGKVRCMILAYTEKNESDYLKHHRGWGQMIEDIHVGYFTPGLKPTAKLMAKPPAKPMGGKNTGENHHRSHNSRAKPA